MHRYSRSLILTLTVLLLSLAPAQADSSDDRSSERGSRTKRYAVTVTNLTRGQIMSAPVVFSHNSMIRLFELGQPATPKLAALAEDADATGLIDLLWDSGAVQDVNQAMGGIMPGKSATIEIEVRGNRRLISVASMLVTSNDAFTAVSGVRAPNRGVLNVRTVAYDAGSEANNENCDYIPGPPCGNPFQRSDEDGEGFVHVHAGIHGGGSLDPAQHDWRNPVAAVSIKRMDDDD